MVHARFLVTTGVRGLGRFINTGKRYLSPVVKASLRGMKYAAIPVIGAGGLLIGSSFMRNAAGNIASSGSYFGLFQTDKTKWNDYKEAALFDLERRDKEFEQQERWLVFEERKIELGLKKQQAQADFYASQGLSPENIYAIPPDQLEYANAYYGSPSTFGYGRGAGETKKGISPIVPIVLVGGGILAAVLLTKK